MKTYAYELYRHIVLTDNIEYAKSIIQSHEVKRQVSAEEYEDLFDIYVNRVACEEGGYA